MPWWSVKIAPHLKRVATLPCENIVRFCVQGTVATRSRCGGIFNGHIIENLQWNHFENRSTFDEILKLWSSVAYFFYEPPCIWQNMTTTNGVARKKIVGTDGGGQTKAPKMTRLRFDVGYREKGAVSSHGVQEGSLTKPGFGEYLWFRQLF